MNQQGNYYHDLAKPRRETAGVAWHECSNSGSAKEGALGSPGDKARRGRRKVRAVGIQRLFSGRGDAGGSPVPSPIVGQGASGNTQPARQCDIV